MTKVANWTNRYIILSFSFLGDFCSTIFGSALSFEVCRLVFLYSFLFYLYATDKNDIQVLAQETIDYKIVICKSVS